MSRSLTSASAYAYSEFLMRALPDFDAAQWSRELHYLGLCGKRRDLPWTDNATPTPIQMRAMQSVCEQCPIRRECASFALNERCGRGTEGGFYAGVWWPWVGQLEPSIYTRRGARKYLLNLIPLLDYRTLMERNARGECL